MGEWLGSHTLPICRLATVVEFMGFLVFFFFSFFCYCFSLITSKTSLSQDFLLSIFLLLSFMSTVSPVKAAAWWNDVKNQGHSCIYCARASLKQVQIARLFYLKRTIYLQEIKTPLLQLLVVALQTPSLHYIKDTQYIGKDTCAQLRGWDVTKLSMVPRSFVTMWVKVQFTRLQQEPIAIRAGCLPPYEKHKVWSLLLVAYFCGMVFALLSLLPLKSLPHQVQRKQIRERMLFFSAPMTKQQQQLIGAVVWWPTDATPAVGGQWRRLRCSHIYTLAAFSMSSYIYFSAYMGQGSSWPGAEVAAEKQSEVRGCWDEISAPSVKIKELWAVRFLILSWIWKSISNTVCTRFQGYFAQVLCI